MGHSHSHGGHHHHDNTFLTSKNKDDPGVRITKIGLYVNVGMAISKGIGGYAFNSQAYVGAILQNCAVMDLEFVLTIPQPYRRCGAFSL